MVLVEIAVVIVGNIETKPLDVRDDLEPHISKTVRWVAVYNFKKRRAI